MSTELALAPACVLTFHRVVADSDRDHDIRWTSFRGVLDCIADLDVAAELGPGALRGSGVVLTFDDGTIDHLEVARALHERDLRGVFFVTVGRLGCDGFLSTSQVRELRSMGHSVASHGLCHKLLPTLAPNQREREIVDSRARLEDLIGERVRFFAPPSGVTSRAVAELVRRSGYEACRLMNWGLYSAESQRWTVPCVPVTEATLARGWVASALIDRRLPIAMHAAGLVKRLLPPSAREWARRHAQPRGAGLLRDRLEQPQDP